MRSSSGHSVTSEWPFDQVIGYPIASGDMPILAGGPNSRLLWTGAHTLHTIDIDILMYLQHLVGIIGNRETIFFNNVTLVGKMSCACQHLKWYANILKKHLSVSIKKTSLKISCWFHSINRTVYPSGCFVIWNMEIEKRFSNDPRGISFLGIDSKLHHFLKASICNLIQWYIMPNVG